MDIKNIPIEIHFLNTVLENFTSLKTCAEKAVEQLNDDELFYKPDTESNSVNLIMKHMSGNMRSRWTDFLTSDGEKPDRNRDNEFINELVNRNELLENWNTSWKILFDTLTELEPDDLGKKVYIRKEEHTVLQAINRQLSHYAYHVGQIVFVAKHIRSEKWDSLSIPKGKSEEFNARS